VVYLDSGWLSFQTSSFVRRAVSRWLKMTKPWGFVIVRRRGDLLSCDEILDQRAAKLAKHLEAAGVV
jgi:hypothetical protein